jgi:putative acetyltransferase
MPEVVINPENPATGDVRALLERHLAFTRTHSAPEDRHALDADGLSDPAVALYGCRIVAIGALKEVGPGHVELKSMHTAAEHRGRGLARAMLAHLLDAARDRGAVRVSIETGSGRAYAPAQALYAAAGFTTCEAFGDYSPSANSTFMTRALR